MLYPLHSSSKFRPVETFDRAIFVRLEVGCERLGTSDPNWSSGKDQTPCGIVAWSIVLEFRWLMKVGIVWVA